MNLTKLLKTGIILILFNVLCAKLAAQETINTIQFTCNDDHALVWIKATANKEFTIDWGDSTIETKTGDIDNSSLSHTYAVKGEYMVTITGSTPDCRFNYFNVTPLTLYFSVSSLALISCTDLDTLYCQSGQLQKLDLSGCPELTHLGCDGNQLTELDLSGCTKLTELMCGFNQLSSLDLSLCPKLTYLICGNNQLTELDLSGCPELTHLGCSGNQLAELDLSGCHEITHLGCSGNQLAELDLSGCPDLESLYCFGNQLPLSDLFKSHLLIDNAFDKRLGTQNLQPQTVRIAEELFANQSVFGGIFTNYSVIKNENPALESDYTVMDGKLIFNAVGQYTVTMTNDAIVSNEANPARVVVGITVEKGTGIEETKQSDITVYPNPATTEINVKLNSQEAINYTIYNIRGQQVKRGKILGEANINIQSLLKGIYYMKLDGTKNRPVSFIKQ